MLYLFRVLKYAYYANSSLPHTLTPFRYTKKTTIVIALEWDDSHFFPHSIRYQFGVSTFEAIVLSAMYAEASVNISDNQVELLLFYIAVAHHDNRHMTLLVLYIPLAFSD